MNEQFKEAIRQLEGLLGSSDYVEIDVNDPSMADVMKQLNSAQFRLVLSKKNIVVSFPVSGSTTLSLKRIGVKTPAAAADDSAKTPERKAKAPKARPTPKRHQHTYVPTADAMAIIEVMTDPASHVVQLVGPTGCGKTTLVKYLGRELGRLVYQINCRGDMGSESFFGEKTIEIDPQTHEQVMGYQKGILEQAMTEGLDEDGNEVGSPAILFLDELPACPAHIGQGLNNFLESDDPRRKLVLDQDGGRVVTSHSGLRIIVAGNTMGRGAQGAEMIHTAQMDALDFSLLSRVAVAFRMGYNREVEKHILAEKIGDDRVTQQILEFRDVIRGHIKAGKLTTPFGTRNIVNIADMYRIWHDLGKAVYYTTFEFLNPEEKAIYNETAVAVLGKDLLKEYFRDDVDYM